MERTKSKKYIKQATNIWAIILISIFITFMFAGIESSWQAFVLNVVYGTLIGMGIALGCGYISTRLLQNDEWLKNPTKRYVITILAVMLYIFVFVALINMAWFSITQDRDFLEIYKQSFFVYIMVIEFVIGLIIYLIILSKNFVNNLDKYYQEAEKSKAELDKYKYATLKNQINPHFLFNTLNVLSGLIYKDVDKADDFIGKLANIYRYVLDVQDEEVVSINQEIAFANDYLFLQSMRFGDHLQYEITAKSDKQTIPLALQLLIENALKHNAISEDAPLKIEIKIADDHIIVSNNINPKEEKLDSHEIGLENIKGRYQFLSDQAIIIENSDSHFSVALPILNYRK